MNLRMVRYSCFLVCLLVLLGFSWTAPAAAGDAAGLRLAAGPISGGAGTPLPGPIPSPQTPQLVGGTTTQPPATSVTPKAAGSTLVPAKARLIKVEGLTRQQADQLQIQNSDVIEYKGKQYNVGILRSQMQKAEAAALPARKQKATEAKARFEAYRTNFTKVQLSNLAAANAKTDAMAKQLLQRMQASGKAPPPSKPKPVIEGTTKEATQGARVLIVGSGFGNPSGVNAPGVVILHIGNREFSSYPVTIEWWSDTAIYVTIPAGITGVPDQPGTLVVNVGGMQSNLWPVQFIAARDVVLMVGPQGVQVVRCSDSAPDNWCDNYSALVRSATGYGAWNTTFAGRHMGAWYKWVEKGSDVYSASLINGWTFDSAITWYLGPTLPTGEWGPGGSGAAILNGFQKSSSSLNLVVDWNFDVIWFEGVPYPGDHLYTVDLYIVGPRGVPHY